MWTELFDIFRGGDALDETGALLLGMLRRVASSLTRVQPLLLDAAVDTQLREAVFADDALVNADRRRVQERVLTHLAVNPNRVARSIELVNLARDVERAGDHVKDLVAVSAFGPVPPGPLRSALAGLLEDTAAAFGALEPTLQSGDAAAARTAIADAQARVRRCDALVVEAAASAEPGATVVALLARGCGRLSAHGRHLLASVAGPAHTPAEVARDDPGAAALP